MRETPASQAILLAHLDVLGLADLELLRLAGDLAAAAGLRGARAVAGDLAGLRLIGAAAVLADVAAGVGAGRPALALVLGVGAVVGAVLLAARHARAVGLAGLDAGDLGGGDALGLAAATDRA